MRGETVTISSVHDGAAGHPRSRGAPPCCARSRPWRCRCLVRGRVVGVATPCGLMRDERCVARRSLVNRLRLVAQVFASVLARKRSDEELRASPRRGEPAARDGKPERTRTNTCQPRAAHVHRAAPAIVSHSPGIRGVLEQGAPGGSGPTRTSCCSAKPAPAKSSSPRRPRHEPAPLGLWSGQLRGHPPASSRASCSAMSAAPTPARCRSDRCFERADQAHAVPRRDRRPAARCAGEAAARPPGGEVERVGGRRGPVDVRIVAATHRDLEQAARRETFRDDLDYPQRRPHHVPPLRERPETCRCWRGGSSTSSPRPRQARLTPGQGWWAFQRDQMARQRARAAQRLERAVILPRPAHSLVDRSAERARSRAASREPASRSPTWSAITSAACSSAPAGAIRGSGGAAELLGMKPSTAREPHGEARVPPAPLQ